MEIPAEKCLPIHSLHWAVLLMWSGTDSISGVFLSQTQARFLVLVLSSIISATPFCSLPSKLTRGMSCGQEMPTLYAIHEWTLLDGSLILDVWYAICTKLYLFSSVAHTLCYTRSLLWHNLKFGSRKTQKLAGNQVYLHISVLCTKSVLCTMH